MRSIDAGEWFRPEEGETYGVGGGPVIVLRHRSHKRPLTGGPTKETTVVGVELNGERAELELVSRGVQGKPQSELHPVEWKGWIFTSREDTMVVVEKA